KRMATTATSDFLLAGLIVCTRCGKRYVGNAAHGKTRRYRYYTCFSRLRYGTRARAGDRLRAAHLAGAALWGAAAPPPAPPPCAPAPSAAPASAPATSPSSTAPNSPPHSP